MAPYTRREVSGLTGIGFDALRYYERFGLIPLPERNSNKYRQYDDDLIERLNYIKQARKCGFSLNEIRMTLEGIDHPGNCTSSSDEIIDRKVQDLDNRIADLNQMKDMLLSIKEPLRNRSCEQILSFRLEGRKVGG